MNKIWIEIEVGTDAENHERARLANEMISRLHHNDDDRKLQQTLEWSEHHGKYILKLGPSGAFKVLEDNGEWFNLDYFGGPSKFEYMTRHQIYATAMKADPSVIDKIYREAIGSEDDKMANAMAVEAVYLHLRKEFAPVPDWWGDVDDNVTFVKISTGETVPVFTEGDIAYSEW